MTHTPRIIARRAAVLALCAALFVLLAAPAPGAQAARQRCFPETGFCASGAILDYWERNGGLPVFGYPISGETIETIEGSWSGPTQWFERDRLEDHSNEGKGVLAGRLGDAALRQAGIDWQSVPGDNAITPGCRFFRETQFNLCEPFLSYWEQNGGLERFGYPLTRQRDWTIEGRSYTVQYFERRRMEYHPEHAGTPYAVQLGLLGNDLFTTPASTPMWAAQEALTSFLTQLNVGNYEGGAGRFAGDYAVLQGMNPDVTGSLEQPEVRQTLWRRACTANGFFCLRVRQVFSSTSQDPTHYTFVVSLSTDDGRLFGGAEGRTRFTFHVERLGGQYFVTDLPPYMRVRHVSE